MEQVVTYVLELRGSSTARSALRRAGSPATEHRAYGYLAPWWVDAPYRRAAICAFAGLVGAFPDLRQSDDVPLGAMAANLVSSGVATQAGIERKLVVAQSAPLAQLVVLLRSLLRQANSAGHAVDFNDVYWVLAMAEHPDAAKRTRSRQSILETFYQELVVPRASRAASAGASETSEAKTEQSDPTTIRSTP